MKRLSYKYLVSQVQTGLFHVEHQMPANPDTTLAVYTKYCELCNIAPREHPPKVYFGHFMGTDVWFLHPQTCPRGLLLLARRHLSAKHRITTPGQNGNLRNIIFNALGFRRNHKLQGEIYDRLLIPIATRAKEVPLAPQQSGLYAFKRAIGVEIEGTSPLSREELNDALPFWTNVVDDRSIRAIHQGHRAAEVRILMNRASFDQRINAICKRLSAVGFTTNRSCGLHVHMDARHITLDARKRTQKTMTAWLTLLVELMPESRRDNTYCKLDTRSGRYCAVSIETGGKNTIEVRLHSATIDQNKITMWVRLIELLAVLPAPARKLTNTLAGLESLPMCDWDKSYWRARHQQLNPNKYPAGTLAADANE